MKIDLNTNRCQWKHMGKNLCDYIKAQKMEKRRDAPDKLFELGIDEITEFAIYDSSSRQIRKELLSKKVRKVYCGTAITLKVLLKNILSVSVDI